MESQQNILKYIEEKCRKKNLPFSVILELTGNCNLSCSHCYRINDNRQELTYSEITDILDQLVTCGTFIVGYTGGEIFSRPDFFDILTYAKKKGFFQILLTNGTLINRDNIAFLKEIKPLGLEISLLGAVPETHDGITGVSGSFEKTVSAIKLLVEAGIRVVTKTALMKSNISEYGRMKTLVKKLGADARFNPSILPRFDGSTEPQEQAITWDDRKLFLKDDIPDKSCHMRIENDDKSLLTCKAGKSLACISPCGDVCPCVVFPLKLGNIREKTFKQIWHDPDNDILNELRRMKASDLDKCYSCSMRNICSRCTGSAYLEHKSLRAPSSIACEGAKWESYLMSIKDGEASS